MFSNKKKKYDSHCNNIVPIKQIPFVIKIYLKNIL